MRVRRNASNSIKTEALRATVCSIHEIYRHIKQYSKIQPNILEALDDEETNVTNKSAKLPICRSYMRLQVFIFALIVGIEK
jgi:hypothetical protein